MPAALPSSSRVRRVRCRSCGAALARAFAAWEQQQPVASPGCRSPIRGGCGGGESVVVVVEGQQ